MSTAFEKQKLCHSLGRPSRSDFVQFGIEAAPSVHLPHSDCLMVKELEDGALERMRGLVEYSFYKSLT